jgi:hypothetical protein
MRACVCGMSCHARTQLRAELLLPPTATSMTRLRIDGEIGSAGPLSSSAAATAAAASTSTAATAAAAAVIARRQVGHYHRRSPTDVPFRRLHVINCVRDEQLALRNRRFAAVVITAQPGSTSNGRQREGTVTASAQAATSRSTSVAERPRYFRIPRPHFRGGPDNRTRQSVAGGGGKWGN